MRYAFRAFLLVLTLSAAGAEAGEIGFLEDFVLAEDRARAIEQLVPGSDDFYYYQALHLLNTGQLDRVDSVLKTWVGAHRESGRSREIRNRLVLLRYGSDPKGTLFYLSRVLNLRFDHEREISEVPNHPIGLDPGPLSREAYFARALQATDSLSDVEDSGLDYAAARDLSGNRLRDLLNRLQRPDVPDLARLVVKDLGNTPSHFGNLGVHGRLTLRQLDECARLLPGLLEVERFVQVYLSKLQPGPDEDWQADPAARQAYLDRLWALADRLSPAFNSLKACVLFQRLAHDRGLGVYDRKRFLAYARLPRQAPYVPREYLHEPSRRGYAADLGRDFQGTTLLPRVGNDEPLVRDYLSHFFAADEDTAAFKDYFVDSYLREVLAETRLLNGLGDPERWYAVMGNPAKLQALKERVDVEFAPTNRVYFGPEEPVALDLDVKNVKTLIVRVYELHATSYYRERQQEVDLGVNLDGLVANRESTYSFEEPPLRRVRRHFEFPELQGRGVYVVELIGGGKASRALVRKGRLRFLERPGAAGHVFTVLDEGNRKIPDASLWLAGHEHSPREDGTILVPYTAVPGPQPIVLTWKGFSTLAMFQQRSEAYELSAGFFVERETLLTRRKARVLVRPRLTLNGVPVDLSLLQEPTFVVESRDRDGVATSKEVRGFELSAERESIHEFQVPEGLAELRFTLRGRVRSLSEGAQLDLSDGHTFPVGAIEASDQVAALHLARVPGGYALRYLGKTGEPWASRPVRVELKHRDFRTPWSTMLRTDAEGRIVLGELRDIAWLRAQPEGGGAPPQQWALPGDRRTYPGAVHGRAGDTLAVPYVGSAREPGREFFSLLEVRGGTYVRDWFEALALRQGFLEVRGLPAGDYDLFLKESATAIALRLTPGEERDGYVLGESRLLETPDPAPLQAVGIEVNEAEVKIRLANPTAFTRVHVVATRFLAEYSPFDQLASPAPGAALLGVSKPDTLYAAGREIGDEARYILDRRYAPRRPGNLLPRPGLLLNPWVLRKTEAGTQTAAAGEALASRAPLSGAQSGGRATRAEARAAPGEHYGSLDFLPAPAAVLANLRPDSDGVVTIPRKDLGAGQHLHVLAVNPGATVYRQVALAEQALGPRDLRLAQPLSAGRHFAEQKLVTPVEAKGTFQVADLGTSKVEVYESLAQVYRLYATLSRDANLAEFGFLVGWPKLQPEEKREKYSKYACHELNFFLYRKDPEFFRSVILPYLGNKKDKTFLDRWLLGEDLAAYLEPWAYGRLNAVERVLLGRRQAGEAGAAGRHLKDLLELVPPDRDRWNRLFLTALQGSALETAVPLGGETGRLGAKDEDRKSSLEPDGRDRLVEAEGAAPAAAEPTPPPAPAAARPMPAFAKAAALAKEEAGSGEMVRAQALRDDAARRETVRQYYRALDKTQEWAENNYYRRPIEEQDAGLVTVNAFWVDYARHAGPGPFLSRNLAEASRNFTEMMLALAVLDLPFEPGEHDTRVDESRLTLAAASPIVVYHKEIREASPRERAGAVLVSQNLFRLSDRYRYENGERFEKYVTGELLTRTAYGCQVVLTNPTASPLKLDLLLQIPAGAIPVRSGFYTRGLPLRLEPYAVARIEYSFYFPQPGTFPHFPAHVSREGELAGFAPPQALTVVDSPTVVDTDSWDYVSQNGTGDEVLAFLDRDNPNRLDLVRIAWRTRDRAFFGKVTELLSRRHVYNDTLWSYGVHHGEPAAIRPFLQHQDAFVGECGDFLDSPLLRIDPVARKTYQHLEYEPLVNPRAHALGKRRQLLNERLAVQYPALLKVLSYKAGFDDDDLLALTYYLLLQDRVEEAARYFGRADRSRVATALPYDYLQAYLDFFTPERRVARALAERYREYPVDRWRNLFRAVLAQLDEAEGKAAAVVDPESKGETQARLAVTEPSFELSVEARKITVGYRNLARLRVSYYRMDLEVLFSRSPFVQDYSSQFAYVRPSRSDEVELPADGASFTFDLPDEFRGANVLVEAAAGGVKKSQVYFAHNLAVQVVETYGQVLVTRQGTNRPLPGVYVKAFARKKDGTVAFYKDGYTDLRGRFDYTSLNTDELDRVERFSLLVLSEADGAVIREAAPPKR